MKPAFLPFLLAPLVVAMAPPAAAALADPDDAIPDRLDDARQQRPVPVTLSVVGCGDPLVVILVSQEASLQCLDEGDCSTPTMVAVVIWGDGNQVCTEPCTAAVVFLLVVVGEGNRVCGREVATGLHASTTVSPLSSFDLSFLDEPLRTGT